MNAVDSYVRTDEHGVIRVVSTRVMLDSVVAFRRGDSPESILQQDPALTLEEPYGSITDDLAHRDEVDDDPRRQDEIRNAGHARSAENPNPAIERLRQRKRSRLTRDHLLDAASHPESSASSS